MYIIITHTGYMALTCTCLRRNLLNHVHMNHVPKNIFFVELWKQWKVERGSGSEGKQFNLDHGNCALLHFKKITINRTRRMYMYMRCTFLCSHHPWHITTKNRPVLLIIVTALTLTLTCHTFLNFKNYGRTFCTFLEIIYSEKKAHHSVTLSGCTAHAY